KVLTTVAHPDKGIACRLGEQGAIGEAGQRVVARHMGELRFGALLRRDVLVNLDPTLVAHRPATDGDDAPVAQSFDRTAVRTHDTVLDPGLSIPLRHAA